MKKFSVFFLTAIILISLLAVFFPAKKDNKDNLVKDLPVKSIPSPISINYLRSLEIISEEIKIASFLSEGNKVYSLLTVPLKEMPAQKNREISPEIQKIRTDPDSIDFNSEFWTTISLTKNIKYLSGPLQIHHAVNDPVVNIGYSKDLAKVLTDNSKKYEFYEYKGGGHNITSPYFETAMERTVRFFKDNL